MVDVIITTCNRIGFLKATLDSFIANTDLSLIDNIIITDDRSTDGTREYLSGLRSLNNVTLVFPTARIGLVPIFNEAFNLVTNDIICEFQDDVTFSENWLEGQLKLLEEFPGNFITGYDAPEHHVCKEFSGYKKKPSTRFVQLLGRRETFSKWFPMKPSRSFPTPAVVSGVSHGSNIDCKLYRSHLHKNKWSSNIEFIVIPELINTDNDSNSSSWRKYHGNEGVANA